MCDEMSRIYLIFLVVITSQAAVGQVKYFPRPYAPPPYQIRPYYLVTDGREFLKRSSEADKVKIEVYYETDCPDSKRFINNQLHPAFEKLEDIMDVQLIPYGKATETALPNGDYLFHCHHGPGECYGNVVQSCVIQMHQKTAEHLGFIKCMESYWRPSDSGERCAKRSNMDWEKIKQCAEGKTGMELLHENARRTTALKPNLNYVPWIVINNKFSEENLDAAQKNLEQLICETYSGPRHVNCG